MLFPFSLFAFFISLFNSFFISLVILFFYISCSFSQSSCSCFFSLRAVTPILSTFSTPWFIHYLLNCLHNHKPYKKLYFKPNESYLLSVLLLCTNRSVCSGSTRLWIDLINICNIRYNSNLRQDSFLEQLYFSLTNIKRPILYM